MTVGCTRSQRGFTLIEVIVAFAITILVVGALYTAWGGALARSDRARREALAVLHAESLLERAGLEWSLDGLALEKSLLGGLRGEIVATQRLRAAAPESPLRLFDVTVTVQGADARAPVVLRRVMADTDARPTTGR
ncbi:MAG: type II secretion system protein [Steroidobacteraceae bacterium]